MLATLFVLVLGAASALSLPQDQLAHDALGSVKGSVTLNGKPLPEGNVALHAGAAQKPIEAAVKTGKYAAEKVPVGEFSVTIDGVGVPAKFGSAKTTSLKVSIQPGANELNFELISD